MILLADDNKTFLDLLSQSLKKETLKIITSSCVNDALDNIRKIKFDLIISDYDMGDSNGLSILKYLRENDINTKFIMLTGSSSSELKEQVEKLNGIFLDKANFELLKIIRSEIN